MNQWPRRKDLKTLLFLLTLENSILINSNILKNFTQNQIKNDTLNQRGLGFDKVRFVSNGSKISVSNRTPISLTVPTGSTASLKAHGAFVNAMNKNIKNQKATLPPEVQKVKDQLANFQLKSL